jgi:protein phosphatase
MTLIKSNQGPFDIIGDLHGCFEELRELLVKLGYQSILIETENLDYGFEVIHPQGRTLVFLGDLVDRGPKICAVLKFAMAMTGKGKALSVLGNHDDKLLRKLKGSNVQIKHGLEESLGQLAEERPEFSVAVCRFLDSLDSSYFLDNQKLVVAHAGMKEEFQKLNSKETRQFGLFGETTGETDESGLPVRLNWAAGYRGRALVVYGHTPVAEAEWFNRTIDIDTGCVFGGKLTALRYPERELIDVPAHDTYYQPARPFLAETTQKPGLLKI